MHKAQYAAQWVSNRNFHFPINHNNNKSKQINSGDATLTRGLSMPSISKQTFCYIRINVSIETQKINWWAKRQDLAQCAHVLSIAPHCWDTHKSIWHWYGSTGDGGRVSITYHIGMLDQSIFVSIVCTCDKYERKMRAEMTRIRRSNWIAIYTMTFSCFVWQQMPRK